MIVQQAVFDNSCLSCVKKIVMLWHNSCVMRSEAGDWPFDYLGLGLQFRTQVPFFFLVCLAVSSHPRHVLCWLRIIAVRWLEKGVAIISSVCSCNSFYGHLSSWKIMFVGVAFSGGKTLIYRSQAVESITTLHGVCIMIVWDMDF